MKGATELRGVDPVSHPATERLITTALLEDLGRGDVTTAVTVPASACGRGEIVVREPCVIAGLPLLPMVFARLGSVRVTLVERDGTRARAGAVLGRLEGSLRAILAGERLALNLLQRLSGVATLTRAFVEAVAGTRTRILDTRKTTPGLRLLEKYAVRMGGGANHRFGLDDGILIKDNHVVACGSVREAVRRARAHAPHGLRIEVECDRLAQVREAVAAGAHVILLDNMRPEKVAEAIAWIDGRALVEVSGGVDLDSVRSFAEAGADLISVGRLTHSAPAVDIALDLRAPRPSRAAVRVRRRS